MQPPTSDLIGVEKWLIQHAATFRTGLATEAVKELGLSRQVVNRHLRRLVDRGLLKAAGRTKGRAYDLTVLEQHTRPIVLADESSEDVLWRDEIAPRLAGVPANVRDICQYGFTEMFNNVVDHSEATHAWIGVRRTAAEIMMTVVDTGVGVFKKIQRVEHLDDERHAILELCKGKLTTDPARHTGEGIFFTSRMFDEFAMRAGRLEFFRLMEDDWLFEEQKHATEGTFVRMVISPFSGRTMRQVFEKYAPERHDYGFARTHIFVELAKYEGEKLLSRSQAKRLLKRADRFKEVVLDFRRVDEIGQAFADEVFRVFRLDHPDVNLLVINESQEVGNMVKHVRADIDQPFLPGIGPGPDSSEGGQETAG